MKARPDMAGATLERVPMTMGYFRLLLRRFGDTPERRAAILDGTGVTELALVDPSADISLFQQVRQFDNLNALLGEGWAFTAGELGNHSTHGALGIAALTAPNLEGALGVAVRYACVRSPFYKVRMKRSGKTVRLTYDLSVALELTQWRTIIEMAFLGLSSVIATILGKPPDKARFLFACPEPSYGDRVREALGHPVIYNASAIALELPAEYLPAPSPLADAALHTRAVEELDQALHRLDDPIDVRGRVERLLSTTPPGQLDSESAACALGLSHRTMARRLAATGAGFRELRNNELKRRAAALIKAGALSYAQIAERLGYADATSFSRSCRRWFT